MAEEKSFDEEVREEQEKERTDFGSAFAEAIDSVPGAAEPTADEVRKEVEPEKEDDKEAGGEPLSDIEGDDPNAEVIKTLTPSSGDKSEWQEKYENEVEAHAKEKQRNDSWEGRISAANRKTAEAESKSESLQTELEEARTQSKGLNIDVSGSDSGELMAEFDKEYPDLKTAIIVIATAVAKPIVLDAIAKHMPDVKPLQEKVDNLEVDAEEDSIKEHRRLLKKAHPDEETIIRKKYLINWVMGQPTHKQSYLLEAYERGNTQQVIDLIQDFKDSTGWKTKSNTNPTDTKTTESTNTDKLTNLLGVQGDNSPLEPNQKETGADDFSSAFSEAASKK